MLSRRHLLMTAGSAAALAGCATPKAEPAPPAPPEHDHYILPAPPPPSAEQQLATALDDIFNDVLADNPELATSLGLDKGAMAGAKSKLHDASLAAVARNKAKTAARLTRLQGIDRAKLAGMPAVNYDSVLYDLTVSDRANKRFSYGSEGAGNPYVISQISGAYQDAPDFLATQHTIESKADVEAYVSRLGELARVMDEEIERVRHDAGMGVIPPDFALKAAIGQMKSWPSDPEKSPLITSLRERLQQHPVPGFGAVEAASIAYREQVFPALKRQQALLESLLPKATHDAGVWKLPDGEAYYLNALQAQTTSTMTPQEVHDLGVEVTKELHARADVLFKKLGFTKGSVGERYAALFTSKKGVYPNTDAGKAREIADLNAVVKDMQGRLPQYFGTLPKAGLEIRRVPPATEQGASTHYTEGSLDGTRPGIYWLNLRDTAEAPMWDMYTTTYHEGLPGHHLQISLSREADLPMLRKVLQFGAYVEGWALYSEQLAQEMGVYADNPLGELGYIHDALLRSGRLITDTGIHALKWSREKAIAALRDADGDPPALAAQEIERYSVWPGQACSYMVGKLTFVKARDRAKAALGPRFDIRKFHDACLLSGAMPLTVLEAAVDSYIAGAQRA